jgi:outer membrane protein assembly complex protein YaeT
MRARFIAVERAVALLLGAGMFSGTAAAQDTGPADAPMPEVPAPEVPAAIGGDASGPVPAPLGDDAALTPVDEALPPAARYTGRVVALRTLVAPEGGLPAESLEPLLRVQQDTRYDPQAVRQDIAMLHRVLDFAQVEVDVEPWVAFDAAGQPLQAVRVEYRVWPPPRLARVELEGVHAISRRELLGAIGREPGDPYFPDDAARLRDAVEGAYHAIGYPDAKATLHDDVDRDGRIVLRVVVDEGMPNRVTTLRIRGGGGLTPFRVRLLLASAGLRPDHPWTDEALRRAREALTAALRKKGYYEGRATVSLDPEAGGDRVVVIVDPRRKWSIVREGKGLPTKKVIADKLGLETGVRLSRSFAEEAGRTLTEALQQDSHLEALVLVGVEEHEDEVTLRVKGDAGARHRLGRAHFEGDTVYDDRYLTGALKEASPDHIGRGRISPDAVDAALEVMQEFYRSQGYLSARLERVGFDERGNGRVVPVDVRVHVDAGPRTLLDTLTIDGEVGDVDAEALFSDLKGKPLNPAEIEARSRRLVEALNEEGYLNADARASTVVRPGGEAADVRIAVTPGPVVYLRTVLLRGHRRTRRSVIEREIDVHTGDPLVPSQIAAIRRRLYELDVFSRVSAELVGDEDRVKDLFVEVEEKPNLHFELGGGVATDQGIKVFARGGHRNLFGLGHRLTLLGQAGVGWVGDGWGLDWIAPEWKAAARYEAPNLPTRGEQVAVDLLFNEQQQEPSYRLERSGAGVGVTLKLGQKATAELAYRVQLRRLLDVDPGAIVTGDPWLDELGVTALDDPQPALPSAIRKQSGLDLSFVLDLRDDPFNPTRGGVGSLLLNVTDQVLSDVTFLRGEASWAWWLPVGGFGLQGRVRGGLAWVPLGGGTLPVEDRFRLGGGASLRGFELDSVGPANEVSRERIDYPDALQPIIDYGGRDEPARWVATGGDAMALASLEFRIPFERLGLKKWAGTQLAVFGDVGNVWFLEPGVTDSMTQGLDPPLRWSVGVGLRRSTVIGPIQVDVGFDPAPYLLASPNARLAGEDLVRLHVSLGAL